MAKPNYSDVIPKMQADFRTGAYSIRKLADKYDVSIGFVAKHTSDLGKDLESVVNAGVAYKQALASENEHLVNAVNTVVDERTKHTMFFNNSALRNQQLANKKLSENMAIQELEAHSRLTAKNKETVLGKQPDTAIQVNQPEQPRVVIVSNANRD